MPNMMGTNTRLSTTCENTRAMYGRPCDTLCCSRNVNLPNILPSEQQAG